MLSSRRDLFLLLVCLVTGGGCDSKKADNHSDAIEIIAISGIPDPTKVPYPNGASVCLCRNPKDEKILVALPAFKDRKMLPGFSKIQTGTLIQADLIPWQDRPAAARAMFFANDFADEFDLMLFYTESFTTE